MNNLKMKEHDTRGLLITVCGLDGSGKTTLIKRLKKEIEDNEGYEVILTKQPSENMRKSDIFRTYMDSDDHRLYDYRALSLMAAADRIQHINKVILPELKKGKCVICDRYFYSCLANLRARGYEKDRWIYDISKNIIKPDVSFFLDVPVELAVSRVRERAEERDRYIDMDLQYKLRKQYIKICKESYGTLVASDIHEDKTFSDAYKQLKNVIERRNEKNV